MDCEGFDSSLGTQIFFLFHAWDETTEFFKLLLDEVFAISRIIKVEVGVNSRSLQRRLITLTEILIILNITETDFNNFFIYIGRKKMVTTVSESNILFLNA